MNTQDWLTAITGFLVVVLPAVVKLSHALGYELPWLTAIADWFANRPNVAIRRANKP